jgi:excisionase family DNA binding protein
LDVWALFVCRHKIVFACPAQLPNHIIAKEFDTPAPVPFRPVNCVDVELTFHDNAILFYFMQESQHKRRSMAISFSIKVAAEESGLSERTLHTAIKDGRLGVLRVGRRVLVTTAALQEFLHGRATKVEAGAR